MATWIIGGLLAVAVVFAARYVWKKAKNGECAGGCAGCGGACRQAGRHAPHIDQR